MAFQREGKKELTMDLKDLFYILCMGLSVSLCPFEPPNLPVYAVCSTCLAVCTANADASNTIAFT